MVHFRKNFAGFIISLLAVLSLQVSAEVQLSLRDRLQLQKLKSEQETNRSRSGGQEIYIQGFIKLTPGQSQSAIEDFGVNVLNRIDDILIVSMPLDAMDNLVNSSAIRTIEFAEKLKPLLVDARKVGAVDSVHSGTGLEGYSFDGQDILVGIFDTGLDPNNPNFADRVEAVFYYPSTASTQNPVPEEYYGDEVGQFTTDTQEETHGTHVLGILTGNVSTIDKAVLVGDDMKPSVIENASNPFNGVAPGAGIMVACTPALYNTFIIDGIKRMIEYAESQSKFPVINLSLGGNSGPHDGSLSYIQTLTALGERANIVIASGNEGDDGIAITKSFSSDDESLMTFFSPGSTDDEDYSDSDMDIEFWSDDDTDFDANIVFYNSTSGNKMLSSYAITTGRTQSLDLTKIAPLYFTDGTITYDKYYYSNGRYCSDISISGATTRGTTKLKIGIQIDGNAGKRIDGFLTDNGNNGARFSSYSIDGASDPDGNMSINSMACGDNVIVIGASVANPYWYSLKNYETAKGLYYYASAVPADSIASFTSFGQLIDGKCLPHFAAPGAVITSSLNSYYTDTYSNYEQSSDFCIGKLTTGGRTYYWEKEMGTSMAAPFAAGVIALWQQAGLQTYDKYFSSDEIITIAKKTAIVDDYVKNGNSLQWGAGKINAYDGIKYILSTTAAGNVAIDELDNENSFMFSVSGKTLNVFVAGASSLKLDLISVTGQRVLASSVNGNEFNQSLAYLASGIYILTVTTPEGGHYTRKIILR